MYTPVQQMFLEYITQKVQKLFEEFPVPVHSFEHAEQVANFSRRIAEGEGSKKIWLCEVTGIIHDIGRASEKYDPTNTLRHHELSYILLKKWFQEDSHFDIFTLEEKKELLYAVRYHWNDAADEYDTAWILRDADKMDLFGNHGIERSRIWCGNDPAKFSNDFNMKYYCWYWIHTKTARDIALENNFLKELDEYHRNELQKKILPIEL